MVNTKIKKFIAVFLAMLMVAASWTYTPADKVKAAGSMSQADALVAVALSQEGYKEWGDNHTKYNKWYYGKDISAQWCATFISWCANQAGIPKSIIGKNAKAGGMGSKKTEGKFGGTYYPKKGFTPRKGDLIYYKYNYETSVHVEIVTSVDTKAKKLKSIGGNTGHPTTDYVYVHSRSFTAEDIAGYERINYTNEKTTPKKPDKCKSITANGEYKTTDNITIKWAEVNNADKYEFIVKDGNNKEVRKKEVKGTGSTSYNIGKLSAGSYNITVTPVNNFGRGSAANKKITVTAPKAVTPKPGKCGEIKAEKQYQTIHDITLNWKAASNANSYKVLLKDSNNKKWKEATVKTTSYNIGKLPAGKYTFEVTPNNSTGNGENAFVSFMVIARPGAFKLTTKVQYTTDEDIVVNWSKSENATIYKLIVYKTDGEKEVIAEPDREINGTEISCNIGKKPVGEYRVQVGSYNKGVGYDTVWGSTEKMVFNVVAPESEKLSPGAFAVTVKDEYPDSEEIVISWTASSNAQNYRLIIEDKDGKEVVNKEVAGTSSKIDKLPAGDYTVKMTAINDSESCSAADKSFTVMAAAEKPTVTEPNPAVPEETDPATPTEPDETDPTESDETNPTAPTESAEEIVPVSGDVEIELNDLGGYPSDENLEISWRGASGAQSYKAVLSLVGGESIERSVSGESADFGKQRAGLYSLTVIPYGSSGEEGEESTVGLMVFDKPVVKCSKYSDSQGNNLKLTWNKVENAEEYAVEIIDSDSEYQVLSETTTNTSYVANIPEGNYNIYVEAINGDYSILSDCCAYTCTEEDMEEEDDEEPELMLKVKSRTYKRNTDLKKAKSFFIKASAGKADIVYTLSTSAKKAKIKVSENGKVKVPRGCRRGKYFITVTAYGNGDDEPVSKTVKIIVK